MILDITSSGKKEKKEERFAPWNTAATAPDQVQQRRMLTEALRVGLKVVMENHVYEFDGEIRQQLSGGAIGLELTGNIAQVFMIWWDLQLKSRLSNMVMDAQLFKRYVDDVNLALRAIAAGTRYSDGAIYIDQDAVAQDLDIPADQRTMAIVKAIGNDIHHSIQLEEDYPSKHSDNKLPSLDLKVWIEKSEGSTSIMHEFYSKDVSSNLVVHAKSALSWSVKRTVLSQEVLRVILNCSTSLPWERVVYHASQMMLRIQFSGYTKKFRYQVACSALKAYDTIRLQSERGERPLHRPYEWNRMERDAAKTSKKLGWYKKGGYESVIFVPSTPNGELQKEYQREIDRSGLPIRAIETAGRSLKNLLQRSNPFRGESCRREASCLVCSTGGKGSCDKTGVNYNIECVPCENAQKHRVYRGESSDNAYTRGKKHLQEFNGRCVWGCGDIARRSTIVRLWISEWTLRDIIRMMQCYDIFRRRSE